MTEAEEFGRKVCDVPGFESVWVRFATRGYPRKLRREWDEADADGVQRIVLRYVQEWNVPDVAGAPVPLPAAPAEPAGGRASLLDDVEDAGVVWLVRAFQRFWLVELLAPRPN